MSEKKVMTKDKYFAEGKRLFGGDMTKWRFVCPVCGHVASMQDYIDAGADDMTGFSCIGRVIGGRDAFTEKGQGPCNYAGGGLFRLSPIQIGDSFFFDFDRGGDN